MYSNQNLTITLPGARICAIIWPNLFPHFTSVMCDTSSLSQTSFKIWMASPWLAERIAWDALLELSWCKIEHIIFVFKAEICHWYIQILNKGLHNKTDDIVPGIFQYRCFRTSGPRANFGAFICYMTSCLWWQWSWYHPNIIFEV